jgi:hypothetical protein
MRVRRGQLSRAGASARGAHRPSDEGSTPNGRAGHLGSRHVQLVFPTPPPIPRRLLIALLAR